MAAGVRSRRVLFIHFNPYLLHSKTPHPIRRHALTRLRHAQARANTRLEKATGFTFRFLGTPSPTRLVCCTARSVFKAFFGSPGITPGDSSSNIGEGTR
ncbi:hypothetical protein PM082_008841 [Marasmius tenuissimus]|nr:hypothetical protein PM082_008841 [Marasmius tenuissimus]